jgi:hypothetical protein
MHSEWFNEIEILQGRWQHGEKVGYCYHSGLEKTLRKWEIYVPLVTKGLREMVCIHPEYVLCPVYLCIIGETSLGYGWGSSNLMKFLFD